MIILQIHKHNNLNAKIEAITNDCLKRGIPRWRLFSNLFIKVRNALFLHCRNCDSLTVVTVAHFDPHLAGRHLSAIQES